jgi:hypothetical protein
MLVVDDEPLARRKLRRLIEAEPGSAAPASARARKRSSG